MPERWRRRLKHQFWRPEAFRAELARLVSGEAGRAHGLPDELMARLDPARPADAETIVAEYLEAQKVELIGTRTLAEIAERLVAAAADARETPLAREQAALIEAYVALSGPAADAVARIRGLLGASGVDLAAGLDALQRRLDLLQQAGVEIADAEFSAEFGRNLEYYTGFVFEIVAPALGPKSPLAGGGRYDSLLAHVGAPGEVAAVGACIHTERLLAVLGGGAP
jgi:ATP phosphoribosyltransferase regulatory subunit